MSEEKFWILWSPISDKPPRQTFSSVQKAEEVADIMAKKHPEAEFIVMEAIVGKLRSKKTEKKTYSRKPKKAKAGVVAKVSEAPVLRTYKEWKDLGFQVRQGEKNKGFRRAKDPFTGGDRMLAVFGADQVDKP
jgi:hypothetical protein